MWIEFLPNVGVLNLYLSAEDDMKEHIKLIQRHFGIQDKNPSQSSTDGFSILTWRSVKPASDLPDIWSAGFPMSANDLKDLAAIRCTSCRSILTNHAFERILDLPSSHWMELIDCWSCHQSEFAGITNSLTLLPSSQKLLPPANSLFVGLDQLLVCKDDVGNENLVERGNLVHCSKCSHFVGTVLGECHIGLAKHALLLEAPTDCFIPGPSPIRLLAHQLHELLQHHGSSKFILHSVDANERPQQMQLELLNWNLVSLLENGTLERVLKASWRTLPDISAVDPADFEHLYLDPITYQAILQTLSEDPHSLQHGLDSISNVIIM